MATELRLRGGTTAQHASFTGATKEITVDTTKNTVVVHDGSTAGGVPLATESNLTSEVNNSVHAPGTGLPNEIQTYFNNTLTSTSTEQALTAAQGKVLQDITVKLTGDQTIEGVKTFSSSPVVPDATANNQALARGQVAVANSEVVKTALNAVGDAPIYACRAWVNFRGTGAVLIRASGNVSSITDNGTGDYTVNFATAMPDADYCAVYGTISPAASNTARNVMDYHTSPKTTTRLRCLAGATSTAMLIDSETIQIAIFR